VTEEQWKKIEKTLLPGMDPVHFRKQLERIARNDATPAQQIERCNHHIDVCRRFLRAVPRLDTFEDKAAITAQVERQIQLDQQTRDMCQRLVNERSGIFLRQCEIILLWQSRGGEVLISEKGPHVDFFAAADATVFDRAQPLEAGSIRNKFKDFRRLKVAVLAGAGNMSVFAEIIPAPTPTPDAIPETENAQPRGIFSSQNIFENI
jgi:hypothetical protein